MQTTGSRSEKRVLIIGAGCFGLSTAYYLLQPNQFDPANEPDHPRYKVTIFDSSSTLPAPDAASSDLNKVVRSGYSDRFYTSLAREAIALWKKGSVCGEGTYHESGVLVLGLKEHDGRGPEETIYANLGLQNDIEAGANVKLFSSPSDIHAILPEGVVAGTLFNAGGAYLNSDGGWASASKAMSALLENVKNMGGDVITGQKMTGLLFGEKPGDKIVGVMLEEGRVEYADTVVLALGAWTPSVIGNIEPLRSIVNDSLTATGQTVATIKLSPEVAEMYKNIPVLLDWSTGFYMFPPNEEHVIKFVVHAKGHTHIRPSTDSTTHSSISTPTPADTVGSKVSTPRTVRAHGSTGTNVPREAIEHLYHRLESAYPKLAQLPLETTRLCWYTDTPDENWMIDEVPNHPGLFLATGGSGHAFKFLPVIGRLVKDRIEGKMEPSVASRFAIGRDFTVEHDSRHGHAKELEEDSLLSAKDYNEYLRHK